MFVVLGSNPKEFPNINRWSCTMTDKDVEKRSLTSVQRVSFHNLKTVLDTHSWDNTATLCYIKQLQAQDPPYTTQTNTHGHFLYLSLAFSLSLCSSSPGLFLHCVSFQTYLPSRRCLFLCLGLHFVTVSSCFSFSLLHWSLRVKRNKLTHTDTHTHTVPHYAWMRAHTYTPQQVILRFSTVHLVTLI